MKISMTERETRWGWGFFLIYMFIMPLAVDFEVLRCGYL